MKCRRCGKKISYEKQASVTLPPDEGHEKRSRHFFCNIGCMHIFVIEVLDRSLREQGIVVSIGTGNVLKDIMGKMGDVYDG